MEIHKVSEYFSRKNSVFIDKPLTLSIKELKYFKKFVDQKLLMSCSALRFSNELNNIKYKINNKKSIKLVIANVVNDVEKYSVHMLEVVSALGLLNVKKITHLKGFYKPFILVLNPKSLILNCFGPSLFILICNYIFK